MTALANVDRRTLVHLGQPRNVEDLTHVLRSDPHSPTRGETDVHRHVRKLVDAGLVVDLGDAVEPHRLIADAQARTDVLEIEDDKAQTFEKVLARPDRQWRLPGKSYILSTAGVERVHEPVVEERSFTTSQMGDLLGAQRLLVAEPEEIGSLQASLSPEQMEWLNPHSGQVMRLPLMTPDEYDDWLGLVLPEHERVWGEDAARNLRRFQRIAGGAGWTDAYENQILDQENQKTQMPSVIDPWYLALTMIAFGDADTVTTANGGTYKPTYTGYAPKSVAASVMSTASAGSSNNSGLAITFAACTSGSSTIVGFGNFAANSGSTLSGLFRKYGTCSSTTISTTQTPAEFAIGAYVTTAD